MKRLKLFFIGVFCFSLSVSIFAEPQPIKDGTIPLSMKSIGIDNDDDDNDNDDGSDYLSYGNSDIEILVNKVSINRQLGKRGFLDVTYLKDGKTKKLECVKREDHKFIGKFALRIGGTSINRIMIKSICRDKENINNWLISGISKDEDIHYIMDGVSEYKEGKFVKFAGKLIERRGEEEREVGTFELKKSSFDDDDDDDSDDSDD